MRYFQTPMVVDISRAQNAFSTWKAGGSGRSDRGARTEG